MTLAQAQAIIEHNRKVYAAIAHEFEQTRRALHWPVLAEFASNVRDGERILDVGCGSGRLLNYLKGKQIEYVGMDNVEELLEEAKRTHNVQQTTDNRITWKIGDILAIPFRDRSFDHVFAIALLHHIPSSELRIQAMKEMARVLKPGGMLFMTNWNLWRSKQRARILRTWLKRIPAMMSLRSKHVLHDREKYVEIPWINKFEWNDVLVPWRSSKSKDSPLHQGLSFILWRYYHAFTKRELRRLVRESGLELEELYVDGSGRAYGGKRWNWVTVARR